MYPSVADPQLRLFADQGSVGCSISCVSSLVRHTPRPSGDVQGAQVVHRWEKRAAFRRNRRARSFSWLWSEMRVASPSGAPLSERGPHFSRLRFLLAPNSLVSKRSRKTQLLRRQSGHLCPLHPPQLPSTRPPCKQHLLPCPPSVGERYAREGAFQLGFSAVSDPPPSCLAISEPTVAGVDREKGATEQSREA